MQRGAFSWQTLLEKRRAGFPLIAGVVNATPDSFSDGGKFLSPEAGIQHALQLLDEGADWLDLGGESTRPGAGEVAPEEEWQRIAPILAGVLTAQPDAVISVDTRHAAVAQKALAAGARVINDVSGLAFDPEMAGVAKNFRAGVIAQHATGTPDAMMDAAHCLDADNVVSVVTTALAETKRRLLQSGIAEDALMLDVGIGFGKTRAANYELLRHAAELEEALATPMLWGVSRKSFLAGEPDTPETRIAGSLALAVKLADAGVAALRVHDAALTRAALRAAQEYSVPADEERVTEFGKMV